MSAIGDPRLQPQDVRLYIDAEAYDMATGAIEEAMQSAATPEVRDGLQRFFEALAEAGEDFA
jgi:hypothetical protein